MDRLVVRQSLGTQGRVRHAALAGPAVDLEVTLPLLKPGRLCLCRHGVQGAQFGEFGMPSAGISSDL